MPGLVVGAVLFAALLHASWNAMVKARGDTFLNTVLVAAGGALLSALALPLTAAPDAASWPFIAASALIQVAYYALLVAAYRGGDMSQAYPLMRGSAPLLVALASGALIGEPLGRTQWLAIGCICGGILVLSGVTRAAGVARRTTGYALLTACTIAAYTLVDGAGVRRSGAPAAYTMWIFLLTGIGFVLWGARQRPGELAPYARANPLIVLLGGAATVGSYGIALWAMTRAPVAAVAALRETSILFATAIAAIFLREKISRRRLAAIALVAGGAVIMRLA